MERPDLTTLRPWKAEPDADGRWMVTAPPKTPGARRQLVACFLSEQDAREMTALHGALEVTRAVALDLPEAHGALCQSDPCSRCYAREVLRNAGLKVDPHA